MAWPTAAAFTDAVQNPQLCFQTPELKAAEIGRNPRGTPLIFSGNFACVYKVQTPERTCALRCFTREPKNQEHRYNQLSAFLQGIQPPTFVDFEYHAQGIMTRQGQWYPLVVMEWAEGRPLDKHIADCLRQGQSLDRLAARWRGAVKSLHDLNLAHNDLQHGNVLVQNGQIRLVDYDGVFLPQFQGENSPETGHKNYQHPKRTAADYGPAIDNFPALVIYASLLALQGDPALWDRFYNDDNLLLTSKDYQDPGASPGFQSWQSSPNPLVRRLAAQLKEYCAAAPEQAPPLEQALAEAGRIATTMTPPPGSKTSTAASAAPAANPAATPAPPAGSPTEPAQRNYSDLLRQRRTPAPAPANNGNTAAGANANAAGAAGAIAAGSPRGPAAAPPQQQQQSPPAPANTPLAITAPRTRTCPACAQVNKAEYLYCISPSCGEILEPATALPCKCGSAIPAGAQFCIQCGREPQGHNSPRQQTIAVGPASAVGKPAALLPASLAGLAARIKRTAVGAPPPPNPQPNLNISFPGAKLKACPRCNITPQQPGAAFCVQCGQPLP